MITGNTKRSVGGVSGLLATILVGVALLILLGAGVYSRPHYLNAVARETGAVSTGGSSDRVVVAEPAAEADKRSAKKAKQPPPPPPAEPPADTPDSATPPQPPQPPQPAQPAVPAEQEIQDADKSDKDKPAKEKSKEKVKKGELIEAPQPTYPDEAKKQNVEGLVAVVITIGDDGNVIYAKADKGPKELYAVSEAAALKARFKPSTHNGKPVKLTGIITYNFVRDKKE